MLGKRQFRWLIALFLGLALFAAACGSDSDDSDSSSEAADESEDAAAEEPAADEEDEAADEADEPEEDVAAEEEDASAEDEDEDAAGEEEMAMDPQYGGSLSFLLEGETDTWDIPNANCAESCINVMRTISDPLMIINDDGDLEPHLLESLDSNEDFTEWTMVLRDGVLFQDGTPLDAAALDRHLQETSNGLLTGQLLDTLESTEVVDELTLNATFSSPLSIFPNYLAERVGAWVLAPAFYDDPDRGSALPISTGPFQMVEWNRDETTVLAKNEGYWRADAAGNPLPYLDEVVFRPNPDSFARRATMEAGDADVNMESVTDNEEFWRTTWLDEGGQIVDYRPERQTSYLLFNNANPPFDDPQAREALAMCTDREEFRTFRSPDNDLADGPFSPDSLGYIEAPGFPEFDPAGGSAIWDEIGRPDVLLYGYQDTPGNELNGELLQDMWNVNCGLNVELDPFDQSELVTRALGGAFELFQWRNHGNEHPAWEDVWWNSAHAEGIALNFGRIVDADLDELLNQTLTTNDPAELDALAQDINVLFAEEVYNLWLWWSDWIHAYAADVHNVNEMTLFSGAEVQDSLAGRIWVQEAWKES